MSLLSRSTGGRRFARSAAVTAGTLLVWLVVTAIPAAAVTTCTAATITTADDHATLSVGTDDKVLVDTDGTDIEVYLNNGAAVFCFFDLADTNWLEIVGSSAGAETVSIHTPENGDWDDFTTTVDLLNGTDSLVFDYTAYTPAALPEDASQFIGLRQSGSSIAVDVDGTATSAEVRIDNAENLSVNGGSGASGLCASRTTGFGAACDVDLTSQSTNIVATALDDISVPAVNPVTQNLTLNGGAGDDVLASGNGNDNFQGGPGNDQVDYEASASGVTVDLTAATGTGMGNDTLADVQGANGSEFDDTITGNTLDNLINGNDGDDALTGGAGADTVNGDEGDDSIDEGAAASGADTLSGGTGGEVDGDSLNYGARTTNTIIKPGAGAVSGEDANKDGDATDTGDEKDNIAADVENIATGSGDDTFVGSGNDEFFDPGGGTANSVDGGTGTDYLDLSSQPGPATINLANNAGTATLGSTTDTFKNIDGFVGTDGDDTLNWNGTGTLLDFIGGAGSDTVDASTSAVSVTINLSTFTGGANGSVENAIGGPGNDTLTGNNGNNTLTGNDGNDTINAGTGNDTVNGGLGNDILNDGGGADVLDYSDAGSAGVTVDLANGSASGGAGEDTLGCCFETVLGSEGPDIVTAGQTAFDLPFTLKGFGGNDSLIGGNSTDTIRGGAGNDELRGGAGDDLVAGSSGNDILFGSSGDDRLKGGGGNDRGIGGRGFDICKGTESERSCEG